MSFRVKSKHKLSVNFRGDDEKVMYGVVQADCYYNVLCTLSTSAVLDDEGIDSPDSVRLHPLHCHT
jgi:hypothetical protein